MNGDEQRAAFDQVKPQLDEDAHFVPHLAGI
jgi:hypothetical protein